MYKKILIAIGVFFIAPLSILILLGISLVKEYDISYEKNIQKSPQEVMEYISHLENWDKWFIFNSKNSKTNIKKDHIDIITAKNQKITISDLRVKDKKILFNINANANDVKGYFYIEKLKKHSKIKANLEGRVSTPIIGGYMRIFVKSSLKHMLKKSLDNLDKL